MPALAKNRITWDNCVSLAVNNTSVNVGRNSSVMTEARKKSKNIILIGFPCHMTNNYASKATQVFVKVASNSNVEVIFTSFYVYFDYSSKSKIFLFSFVSCVISTCKTINFRSVHWFDKSTCTARKSCETCVVFKKLFLSVTPDMKKGQELKTRNNRLISESIHPFLKQLLKFLDSALPSLIQLSDSFFLCTWLMLCTFAQLTY